MGRTHYLSKHDIYDGRRRDHFSKYDVVKIRSSDERLPIIIDFKKHFQLPFEEVYKDFSVIMQEFFESQ